MFRRLILPRETKNPLLQAKSHLQEPDYRRQAEQYPRNNIIVRNDMFLTITYYRCFLQIPDFWSFPTAFEARRSCIILNMLLIKIMASIIVASNQSCSTIAIDAGTIRMIISGLRFLFNSLRNSLLFMIIDNIATKILAVVPRHLIH